VRLSPESKKKCKIGLVGCGTIGSILAEACKKDLQSNVELIALYDIDKNKAVALADRLELDIVATSLDKLIERSDLVVEAASAKISSEVVEKAISSGKDVMVMSVGGLVGKPHLFDKANKKGSRIYLPSGAICGLDGVKAAKIGHIDSVVITTRKPPLGLKDAPYIKEKGIDLKAINKETLIFKGTAAEAVRAFPQNINVSAVLSFAGVGEKETMVNIVTSPEYKRNTHEIELVGDFGRIYTKCENVPSKENPKTSALAALSAIATLKGIFETVRIGT